MAFKRLVILRLLKVGGGKTKREGGDSLPGEWQSHLGRKWGGVGNQTGTKGKRRNTSSQRWGWGGNGGKEKDEWDGEIRRNQNGKQGWGEGMITHKKERGNRRLKRSRGINRRRSSMRMRRRRRNMRKRRIKKKNRNKRRKEGEWRARWTMGIRCVRICRRRKGGRRRT